MMNIIFLDVDGVLNSYPYFQMLEKQEKNQHDEISDFHLQMLAKIYHTCNAKIVLSSTWRQLNDGNEECVCMYQYLIDALKKYHMEIMDKTPVIGLNRPLEIAEWIKRNKGDDKMSFVSLDDDFSKESYEQYGIGDCLIQTRFFCNKESEGGLQPAQVDLAIKKLKNQLV